MKEGQKTISSYFLKSPQALAKKPQTRKRTNVDAVVDLTSDNEHDQPARKKTKKKSGAKAYKPFFFLDPSSPLASSGDKLSERIAGPSHSPTNTLATPTVKKVGVQKYRFASGDSAEPLDSLEPPPPETPDEKHAKAARREAFKRKLLEDNSIFSTTASGRGFAPVRQGSDGEITNADEAKSTAAGRKGPPAASDAEESEEEASKLPALITSKAFSDQDNSSFSKATTSGKTKGKAKDEEIGPSGQTYTPLEQQVRRLKELYPGTVLMIEVGYKYRFFGEDARVAAKVLGFVAFMDRNFLTAGFPTQNRDVHLKRLLSHGHKVGVIGQIETAALKKISDNRNAPFERQLTHLYTAATYVEEIDSVDDPSITTPGVAPIVLCMMEAPLGGMGVDERVSVGIVAVTPSTGDVSWDEFDDGFMRGELETRMAHLRPSEMLIPESGLSQASEKLLRHFLNERVSDIDAKQSRLERFRKKRNYTQAFQELTTFYNRKHAAASANFNSGKLLADISGLPQKVVVALAHILDYLSSFGLSDVLMQTEFFTKFSERQHMLLNANTLANLEIYRNQTDFTVKGSLMWILDKTRTKFGARLLRNWIGRPLVDVKALQTRTDAVEELLSVDALHTRERLMKLRELLKGLPDLSRGLSRMQYRKCTPKELAILLKAFEKIAVAFETFVVPTDVGFKSSILNEIISTLPTLREPIKDIMSSINIKKALEDARDELWVDPDKYPLVADAKYGILTVESELSDQLRAVRKVLHKPAAQWTSVAGEEYLIEVKKDEKREIPITWHLVSSTKSSRRYHTPEVKEKLQERAQFQEKLRAEANSAFLAFLAEMIDKYYVPFRNVVNKLAVADCLLSLAAVASQDNYVKPRFVIDDVLEIEDGRHPMIEALRSDPFIPNSICLGGEDTKTKIITGPNMGGKSSAVRMIALIAVMAQIGSYVPAVSLTMGVLDAVLTRMGASDDIARGRSTFMIEMSETSDILHSATSRSLVILDELGRGSSTFDGMAVAGATLEDLIQNKMCKTLFITHYPVVAANAERLHPKAVSNVHMGFAEECGIDGKRNITFLYQLTKGISSGSYGIECARLAGIPEPLLEAAAGRANVMQGVVEGRKRQNLVRKCCLIMRQLQTHGRHDETQEVKTLREAWAELSQCLLN